MGKFANLHQNICLCRWCDPWSFTLFSLGELNIEQISSTLFGKLYRSFVHVPLNTLILKCLTDHDLSVLAEGNEFLPAMTSTVNDWCWTIAVLNLCYLFTVSDSYCQQQFNETDAEAKTRMGNYSPQKTTDAIICSRHPLNYTILEKGILGPPFTHMV